MMRVPRPASWCTACAAFVIATAAPGQAHKPITSPYTFTEDVRPILRARCSGCHLPDGVAPMALLTHEETVPWGESIRLELISGHMPPWRVENASSFRDVAGLSARELNVLLTWAVGGTPRGEADEGTTPPPVASTWRLGAPDLVLEPAADFTLAAETQAHTETFTLAAATGQPQWVRAVEIRPGSPSIVRRAMLWVQAGNSAPAAGLPLQRLLALWQPGTEPIALEGDAGFHLPAGAALTLQIDYTKTWQHERAAVTDRTRVGLYFTPAPRREVRALTLAPSAEEVSKASRGELRFSRQVADDLEALAIYPDPSWSGGRVSVAAVHPDGSRTLLIDFTASAGWARRYVFREPVSLPRGTLIEVRAPIGSSSLLPPGAPQAPLPRPADLRITVDGVRADPSSHQPAR